MAKTTGQLIDFIDTRLGEYASKVDNPGIDSARAHALQSAYRRAAGEQSSAERHFLADAALVPEVSRVRPPPNGSNVS